MKRHYEAIRIEPIFLGADDVIVTSTPFDGEDDDIGDWHTDVEQ